MRLALAQINTVVGDLDGNRSLILARLEDARGAGADIALFPELAVTGYPPEDLLLRPGFIRPADRSLEQIAREVHGIVAAVEVKAFVRKRFLPNYGVFDEFRYFAPGEGTVLFELGESMLGVTICENM